MENRVIPFCLLIISYVLPALAVIPVSDTIPRLANGEIWLDNHGNAINAHGGGVIFHDGKYWWYGEHRPSKGELSKGVSLYSSDNLINWRFEGFPLTLDENSPFGVEPGCTIERPKVIYNDSTGKFVMWFHHELKGNGYAAAQAGVATADNPRGPFTVLNSGRNNKDRLPLNYNLPEYGGNFPDNLKWWTPEWLNAVKDGLFLLRDLESGQMSRDMTIFKDSDGKAYHIYSSEENLTLHIAELSDDYTGHTGRYVRIFPGGHNEAPMIFHHAGSYWMITSGCTGWDPNEARLMHSTDIMGEWELLPNPCRGENAATTFLAQGTFIMPPKDGKGKFIAMFDRWQPGNLIDSRNIWLEVNFTDTGTPVIIWKNHFAP